MSDRTASEPEPAPTPRPRPQDPARAAGDDHLAGDELVSRVRIIEEQPLTDRAAAYAAVVDDLTRQLDAIPNEPPTLR